MSEKLLPCPFCGKNEAKIYESYDLKYSVVCEMPKGCGISTGICSQKAIAIEAWNTRHVERSQPIKWPEKKSTTYYSGSITDEDRNIFNRGFNKAIDACRDSITDDEIKNIMELIGKPDFKDGGTNIHCSDYPKLAAAIVRHLKERLS